MQWKGSWGDAAGLGTALRDWLVAKSKDGAWQSIGPAPSPPLVLALGKARKGKERAQMRGGSARKTSRVLALSMASPGWPFLLGQ
jgi:hypothetical protein